MGAQEMKPTSIKWRERGGRGLLWHRSVGVVGLTNKDWSRAKPRFQCVVQEARPDWHGRCSLRGDCFEKEKGTETP